MVYKLIKFYRITRSLTPRIIFIGRDRPFITDRWSGTRDDWSPETGYRRHWCTY